MTHPGAILKTIWNAYVPQFEKWVRTPLTPALFAIGIALIPPLASWVGWVPLLFVEIITFTSAERLLNKGPVLSSKEAVTVATNKFWSYLWASALYNIVVGVTFLIIAIPLVLFMLFALPGKSIPAGFDFERASANDLYKVFIDQFHPVQIIGALLIIVLVSGYVALRMHFVKAANVLEDARGTGAVRRSLMVTRGRVLSLLITLAVPAIAIGAVSFVCVAAPALIYDFVVRSVTLGLGARIALGSLVSALQTAGIVFIALPLGSLLNTYLFTHFRDRMTEKVISE